MLFEPTTIAVISIKNRIVRSATYEKRADTEGFVTDSLIEFYEELTRGGSGLIITGNALVHPSGRSVPQMISIYNDSFIKGLRRLTDAVHKLSGKIIIQIVHGGRQCFPSLLESKQPIAPSEVYDPSIKIIPRAMSSKKILEIIEAFGSASRRARDAGFDGIQIHGAHGYLVSEFLSPHTNRRDDEWGGDEDRRFSFVEKTYKAMRDSAGNDFPIMIKLNTDDFIDGGLRIEESLRIARRLERLGIDAIEVSGGMYESGPKAVKPDVINPSDEAYFRDSARLFKKSLNIPVILVGGIRSRAIAEDVLSSGDADLVSMARPLIREPDLPNKFRAGKEKADCISCNSCMKFKKLDRVRCVQIEKSKLIL